MATNRTLTRVNPRKIAQGLGAIVRWLENMTALEERIPCRAIKLKQGEIRIHRSQSSSLLGRHRTTRRAAMDEVVDWLAFYNARRLRSTLNDVSPMRFEKGWAIAQQGQVA